MKTKLMFLWDLLQTSFWFIPLLIMLIAIGASFGLIYLDSILDYQPEGFMAFFVSGGAESARSILATIAGAMLGVAGTVFSITLVALTLASSQFGSRLLRNFMHDRINQLVLGAYTATFLYCLLVLRTVKTFDDIEFIPNLSVIFAIFLATANIFLLIIFIHHISVSIQDDYVISDVGKNLNKSIRTLFPEEIGKETDRKSEQLAMELKEKLKVKHTIQVNENGYLQIIDSDGLMQVAHEYKLLITMDHRPGVYLVKNMDLVCVYAETEICEKAKRRISKAFIYGDRRTPTQDAEFAIHQLAEVASRALSPGINDPYTAISCIDKLTATMCYLTQAHFPSAYRYDGEKNLRIITRPLNFQGMMDAAFNQIRQFGKDSPSVLIRLMEAFVTINQFSRTQEQKESVERHAKMVYRIARETLTEPNDLDDLKIRLKKIRS
jgi:uncharacterized membrane protein